MKVTENILFVQIKKERKNKNMMIYVEKIRL
jgi:hypothetical protein